MDAAEAIGVAGGAVSQELGRVDRVEPELAVRTEGGLYRASPAASCLIVPERGDRVLVAVAESGEAWVLAVLDRVGAAPPRVRFEDGVEVSSPKRVRIAGDEGLELESRGEVGVRGKRFELRAFDVRAAAERFGLVGGAAEVQLENAKTVVRFAEQVYERLSKRLDRYYRFVEEIEVTRAKEIDTRAEGTVHMRSRNAFVTADELVKVEGDQIHLG